MTDTPQTEEIASVSWLQQRLRLAAVRHTFFELFTLLCVSVALVILTLAAYELSDWLVGFPKIVRLVLTLGGVVAGIFALRRHVPRWIPRRSDAEAMARLAEQAQERDGRKAYSRLVASIEFGQRLDIPGDAQLKNRVIAEARAECMDPCKLRLHNPKHVRLARRLGTGAVLATVIGLLFCPVVTRIFLQRMFGAQLYYPTATVLESVVWQPVTPARQNYPVKVVVRGRIPPSGTLHVRMTGRRSFDLPLLAVEGTNTFGVSIPAPEKSFTFSFRMGDFDSDGYAVHVAEPMYVKSGSIQITPPTYTQQAPLTEPLGAILALEGSHLKFMITPDRAAHKVRIVADSLSLPFQEQKDGAWILSLEATNSFSYEIVMQDSYGMQNADRLKRNVTVLPDAAPTIEVKQPKTDNFIASASLVPLEAQVRDDYGLVKLELAYDIQQHSNEQDVSLRKGILKLDHAAVTGKFMRVEQILRATDLNVKPGQRVVLRLQATDNRPGKPNIGLSPEIALQVVEPDELKRLLAAEMTQMSTLMGKLRDSEKKQELSILQRLATDGGAP